MQDVVATVAKDAAGSFGLHLAARGERLLIAGVDEGVRSMSLGQRAVFLVPAGRAYGVEGPPLSHFLARALSLSRSPGGLAS